MHERLSFTQYEFNIPTDTTLPHSPPYYVGNVLSFLGEL